MLSFPSSLIHILKLHATCSIFSVNFYMYFNKVNNPIFTLNSCKSNLSLFNDRIFFCSLIFTISSKNISIIYSVYMLFSPKSLLINELTLSISLRLIISSKEVSDDSISLIIILMRFKLFEKVGSKLRIFNKSIYLSLSLRCRL